MASALSIFNDAWQRCDVYSLTHAYFSNRVTTVVKSEELLRAEWVARVSALDLYIHEIITQKMLEIFLGTRPITPSYDKFMLPHETVDRIRSSTTKEETASAFDLEIRRQLGFKTYQTHESIAEGLRLISNIELWNTIASEMGATTLQITKKAKALRGQLNAIIDRRNKIAHEGDIQPITPREPWPISPNDLITVKSFIENLVFSIDRVI